MYVAKPILIISIDLDPKLAQPIKNHGIDNVRHYGDVTMDAIASQITALLLFIQPFIQTQIKENIEAPRHWPLSGEFTGDRWIPRTNGQ